MYEISGEISSIFNHIDQNRCLCSYASIEKVKHLWHRLYECCFEKCDDVIKDDNQLLCISFVRLVGEIYTENQNVCCNIHQLFESFLTEDFWKIFVCHLKNMENKYLTWEFIKSFCIILYSCSEPVFCERLHKLFDLVKKDPLRDENKNILDFLSHLVDYQQSKNVCQISTCQNVVIRSILPFKDLFQRLLQLLSEYWPSFENHFHEVISTKSENLNINGFLIVWQKLVMKLQGQELLSTFLNHQSVIAFLLNAYNLNVISLRIYTDIIMQMFISNVKSFEESHSRSVKEAIVAAFDKDFFTLLPHDYQISGLCILTNSNEDDSFSQSGSSKFKNCDPVIAKKITFIFFILIADSKDENLLCSSLSRILDFVKWNFDVSPGTKTSKWILDVFIDQDDILLGVMFALLKIYTVLKEDKKYSLNCVPLVNSINPHEIFISFLQRIGFDHNELLSFLLSDETCFLMYLLKYLKLLLREWELFREAHINLIKDDEDTFELDDSGSRTDEQPSTSANYKPPAKKLLVSYSSSSSDEDLYMCQKDKTKCDIRKKSLIVIVTLSNLKNSIKKLVHAKEFPFNISPLVTMLQACEDHCL